MKLSDTLYAPHRRLSPDKLNPRQHFEKTAIEEMRDNIRQHGIITNLVARPAWCEGTTTAKELEGSRPAEAAHDGPLKIVAGERRWRGADALIKSGELGKFNPEEVPVRICELTDPEYEELTLAEQLARRELTPLEEARSFKRQLAYLGEDGNPRHTRESLAKSLGYATASAIGDRLRLLVLEDTPAALKAFESGKISMKVAAAIARIPDKEHRAAAAKEIIKGSGGEAMSKRETEEFIATNYMRELKAAPFDQSDATLVKHLPLFSPHASCADCPFRTGNNKAVFGDVKRGDICTRPGCFEAKVQATIDRVAARAKAEGKKVLSLVESAQVFPEHDQPGQMVYNSPLVELDAKPEAHLLKAVVKNVPTWREIVEKLGRKDIKVEIIVAFDQQRRPVECVMREPVIAGAEKAGEPIFRSKNEPRTKQEDEFKKRQREEQDAGKLRSLVALASLTAFRAALVAKWEKSPLWEALGMAMFGDDKVPGILGGEGASFLAKWLGLKTDGSVSYIELIAKWMNGLAGVERQAVIPILLLSEKMRWHGVKATGVAELAEWLKVDLKAVEKEAAAGLKKKGKAVTGKKPKEKKPAKPKKPKGAAARAVAAVKASSKAKGKKAGAS